MIRKLLKTRACQIIPIDFKSKHVASSRARNRQLSTTKATKNRELFLLMLVDQIAGDTWQTIMLAPIDFTTFPALTQHAFAISSLFIKKLKAFDDPEHQFNTRRSKLSQ
jgi:hypothetical protein